MTIKNDKQQGTPFVDFTDTKSNIEAIQNIRIGAHAVATDNPTAPFGVYTGAGWHWYATGSVGGASLAFQDEGVPLGTPGTVNFVGNNVSVTLSGTVANVFVTGSSGSGGGMYTSIVSLPLTTGSYTATESTFYIVDISGLTGNKDFNLPTPSSSGKFVGIRLSVGDATYELSLKINGVTLTKIFITGEVIEFVSKGTGAGDWEVYRDGRIPEHGIIEKHAAQSIASGLGGTRIQMDYTVKDVGNVVDLSSGTWGIRTRRDNTHEIIGVVIFTNSFNDQNNVQSIIDINSTLDTYQITYISSSVANSPGMARVLYERYLVDGDLVTLKGFHNRGVNVNTSTTGTVGTPQLSVKELLNPI